jgi:hypothetical protein
VIEELLTLMRQAANANPNEASPKILWILTQGIGKLPASKTFRSFLTYV